MRSPLITYGLLLFGVFALSTSAIFVKLADAPATMTAFYRMFFATFMVLPFLFLGKGNRTELRRLSKKQWGLGLLSGLFLASHYVLWFESLDYTSVASSTVLVTLQPLFSLAGGFFLFKERFNKGAILGVIIAIAGSIVIGWQDFQISGQALFGDILAFIAAGVITAYFFLGQYFRKSLSLVPYSIIGYTSSALCLGVFAFLQHTSFFHYSATTWWAFLGLAFIATILGQSIFNWLLKWLSPTVITMGILGETVGTCILAYFILREALSLQQCLGIMLILIGLAVFLLLQRKRG
ncbi:drug/metabolite transporter (DMT)-like permease [Pullulanibacillus pueri]|uniref:Membrane protein n=1 Tax=Pullulanibacillus pueri TaxID=1437324 RepID=A0A8J2ZQV1_9BACL|nr:DMT family transporter [Pullulanibacillus pueri]MBM7679949.1 drug/metabolite transporter (DMT)-like permease [Pullulanibacillus pueri]GGH73631.1 membrane protein [Pullulanibacillus pueri]